jgi:hypothetical protein
MEEAPENGKELSHFAHSNGMNEWGLFMKPVSTILSTAGWFSVVTQHSSADMYQCYSRL